MRNRLRWSGFVAAVLAAGLLAGCSSVQVKTDYAPETDFSVLKTYAWLDWKPVGNPRIDDDLLHQRVRRAVNAELGAKGFEQSATAPDVWVIEHFVLENKVDVGTYASPAGYGGGYGYGRGAVYTETYVHQYEVGTVILDIVDARSKNLLWRGSGEAQVHEASDPEERIERVNTVVKKVLESFPPGRDS